MKFAVVLLGAAIMVSAVRAKDAPYMQELLECGDAFGYSRADMKDMIKLGEEKMGCIYSCLFNRVKATDGQKLNKAKIMELVDARADEYPRLDDVKKNFPACIDNANDEHTHLSSTSKAFADCAWPLVRDH